MYPESERLAAWERHLANKKASNLRNNDRLGDLALANMSRGAVLGTAEQCEAMHLYRLMMEQRSWSSRMEPL
jgi:hypothetical protein